MVGMYGKEERMKNISKAIKIFLGKYKGRNVVGIIKGDGKFRRSNEPDDGRGIEIRCERDGDRDMEVG